MPASKHSLKWRKFIAEETGLPEESIWVSDSSSERGNVFIWTEKLSKQQFMRLVSATSAGGPTSLRGKLCRLLDDLNADGWMTKVKPSEANKEHDLHPISALGDRRYCSCGSEMFTPQEQFRGKCGVCAPMVTRKG